ncbi:MAG: DUF2721 domain-containing protein [Deltaproteobacteria bacterium]|nr:DUF2721 domain-containing protein [Deltaproteobacteria bacterium]
MSPTSLGTILQASIAPCVLISGVGLVLLALTNRLGRPIDRVRELSAEFRRVPSGEKAVLNHEIRILYRRCHLLRLSVLFAALSIFAVAMIILAFFATYAFGLWVPNLVEVLFTCSLICLMLSLGFFLADVHQALASLRVEVREHLQIELHG